MAEMREIINNLREELREEWDFNKQALLNHYLARFIAEYGELNLTK